MKPTKTDMISFTVVVVVVVVVVLLHI